MANLVEWPGTPFATLKAKIKGDPMFEVVKNEEGRVLPPLILYAIGVPGFLCLVLWAFFFRG